MKDPVAVNLNINIAQKAEVKTMDPKPSARPCTPFPFAWKSYRNDESTELLFLAVIRKTFEIKQQISKNEKSVTNGCCVCNEDYDDKVGDFIECITCGKLICPDCLKKLPIDNTWIDTNDMMDDDNDHDEYICRKCYSDMNSDNANNNNDLMDLGGIFDDSNNDLMES